MRKDHFLVLVLLLSPSLAFGEDGKPKKWWSTPLIIVLYIGFFLVAAGVAICVRHFRDRNLPLHYQHEREVRGLDAEEIESLPSLRFSEAKMHRLKEEDQQVECAVCLSEFKDQEVLRILPDCFHVFHPSCIAPWLSSHVTCPICRSSLEHRQGSSVSMSSAFDATSGPLSQRFGHSGYFQHIMDDNDEDLDHDHEHVTVNIEGSSNVHSEVLSDDGPSTPSDTGKKLHRNDVEDILVTIVVVIDAGCVVHELEAQACENENEVIEINGSSLNVTTSSQDNDDPIYLKLWEKSKRHKNGKFDNEAEEKSWSVILDRVRGSSQCFGDGGHQCKDEKIA
uniref:RING-type E3 ubiquitin transferase n=1 Tax=Chenopodium quinoa TaxID=63459 RepID=A0A803MED5_CHEQI